MGPPDRLTADGFVLEEDVDGEERVSDFVWREEAIAALRSSMRSRPRGLALVRRRRRPLADAA